LKRIIMAGALAAAVLATVLAAAPAANATTTTETVVYYLYPGNGKAPVQLTGNPSSVPAEIHTSPAVAGGPSYGTIAVGKGDVELPPANGGPPAGTPYEGWVLTNSEAKLAWAILEPTSGPEIVIQNVLPGGGTGQGEEPYGEGYTYKCLSFQQPGVYNAFWIQLNAADDWVPSNSSC
jgi:hypothetical protein